MTQSFRLGTAAGVLLTALVAAAASPTTGWAASARPVAARAVSVRSAAGRPADDAPGTRLWVGRYSAPGLSDNRASDIAVSPDSSTVYVTGSTEYPDATGSMPASYFGTVAYNAVTGKRLWVERFLGPGIASYANAIAVSPDGSEVFVTGAAEIGDPVQGSDMATVAYNAATGHYLWSRLYSGPVFGGGVANAVTVSPDGADVYVTGGVTGSSPGTTDLATVAYNAVTGALLWSKRTPGSAATSIAISPDGAAVYVADASEGSAAGQVRFTTVAYSADTGHQQWIASYFGPGEPSSCELAASPDGTKVFTACTINPSEAQYLALGYDAADGTLLWHATYELGNYPSPESAIAATASQVFVTGTANGHIATVAFAADTGSQQWSVLYPTPGGTGASGFAIAVSPDGSTVYAAGGANSSYAIAAYDTATGTRLWGQQWYGDAGGTGMAVAVSPDGASVFVTGVTTIPAGGGSYAAGYGTVAYSA